MLKHTFLEACSLKGRSGLGCKRFWMLKRAILEAYASALRSAALWALGAYACYLVVRMRECASAHAQATQEPYTSGSTCSHEPLRVLKQAFLDAEARHRAIGLS